RLIAENTHPSHAQSLGPCCQPEIFHRQARRIDLDVANAGLAEYPRTRTAGSTGHQHVERRLENPLELERQKPLAAFVDELIGVLGSLLGKDRMHASAPL